MCRGGLSREHTSGSGAGCALSRWRSASSSWAGAARQPVYRVRVIVPKLGQVKQVSASGSR